VTAAPGTTAATAAQTPVGASPVPPGTTPTQGDAAKAIGEAAAAQQQVAQPGTVAPGPLQAPPTPPHEPLPGSVQAERLRPDVGAGAARPLQHTQPIIGGVEGNIPIPVPASPVGLPFAQMGVGDSFEVGEMTLADLQTAADNFAKNRPGAKYEAHPWKDGKVRVWRTG
jgi:hypothetical protein